jgi:hypothetical protein
MHVMTYDPRLKLANADRSIIEAPVVLTLDQGELMHGTNKSEGNSKEKGLINSNQIRRLQYSRGPPASLLLASNGCSPSLTSH